jgi:hypothetical protein
MRPVAFTAWQGRKSLFPMKLWQQIETGADLAATIPSRPIQGRFDCLAKSPRKNHQSFFTYTRTIAIALMLKDAGGHVRITSMPGSGAASAVLQLQAL